MVKLILEQSQRISKLEKKIQKDGELSSSCLKRELSTRLLRSNDSDYCNLDTDADYGFDQYRQKSQTNDRMGSEDLKLSVKYQPKNSSKNQLKLRNKTAGHSDMKGLSKSSRGPFVRAQNKTEDDHEVSETYSSHETRNIIVPNSSNKMLSKTAIVT